LVKRFSLSVPPSRIEAFDAAHISGTFTTAGMSVWQDGRLQSAEYRAALSEDAGEIATLKNFLFQRFSGTGGRRPELVLIDGGRAHVNAAVGVLRALAIDDIFVLGAVKPPRRHGEVSHFITVDGERVEFDPESAAMRMLRLLRDEAHELANSAHQQSRDMSHFYELAAILPSLNERERQVLMARLGSIKQIVSAEPTRIADVLGPMRSMLVRQDMEIYRRGDSNKPMPLIVPIRYDDPNGEAGDLRPIKTIHRTRLSE
jgi:excinuclease ABC subunit C